jgi:hypothetical protein
MGDGVFGGVTSETYCCYYSFSGSRELLCPSNCGNGDGCERKERKERRNRRTEKMEIIMQEINQ